LEAGEEEPRHDHATRVGHRAYPATHFLVFLHCPNNLARPDIQIFGVFIRTLFLNTPSDEAGTSVRGGYVLTLIFLSFLNSCMAPLDELHADRLTFYIHRKASFYRTVSQAPDAESNRLRFKLAQAMNARRDSEQRMQLPRE